MAPMVTAQELGGGLGGWPSQEVPLAPQCPAVRTYHLESEVLLTLNPAVQVALVVPLNETMPTPPRSGGSQSQIAGPKPHSHASVWICPDQEPTANLGPSRRLAAATTARWAAFRVWPRGSCTCTWFLSISSADASPLICPLAAGGLGFMIASLSHAWACSKPA